MAQTTVTRYECDHDLLPMVCVRCGSPATDRVTRTLPKQPKARSCLLVVPLFLILYLAVPAVMVLLQGLVPHGPDGVRVPVCDAHRNDWAWRYRVRSRWLWPLIGIASVAVQVLCLAGVILHPVFYAHAAAGVLVAGFLIDQATVGRKEVDVVRWGPNGIQLKRVHQAFVDALVLDRARDRVDNPDRRALRGDVTDDYDEEPS